MEEAPLDPPYGLVTAGESLHWMDWSIVLRRFREVLVPGGYVAIVGRGEESNPWWPELVKIISVYSTNRDFRPYNVIQLLEDRRLFRKVGAKQTTPVPVEQAIDDYVESIHSRNGFSRDRMTEQAAADFDAEAHRLLERYAMDGKVRFAVTGSVVWGEPCP
jgi:hypothetical protein